MEKRYIGIDLGGTNIKLGLVDAQGRVMGSFETPTHKEEGPEGVMKRMVKHAHQLAESTHTPWSQIAGVGVGLPGFLDIPNGIVKHLTNLGWKDVPIKALLEKEWEVPVQIDNDANVAALGEAWAGAGKGISDLICITLGTGVGGGIISGGKLLRGANGFAGEIGHIQMEPNGAPCNCGQVGCLETISSATGMVRLVTEEVHAGRFSILKELVLSGRCTPKDIFEAAEQGDQVAQEVLDQAITALAKAMAQLSIVLNPACFIIGGGVSKAGETLFRPLRETYDHVTQRNAKQGVQILPAKLGNDAGFIGAAGLLAYQEK